MTTVYCPECEGACSEDAESCPRCGHALSDRGLFVAEPATIECPECKLRCDAAETRCPRCRADLRPKPERHVPPPREERPFSQTLKAMVEEEDLTDRSIKREIGLLYIFGVLVRVIGIIAALVGLAGCWGAQINGGDLTGSGLAFAGGCGAIIHGTVLIGMAGMWGALERISRKS